jgi:hypothetical protein
MTDQERLDFIKKRIDYMVLRFSRSNTKNQLIDDFLWLIDKADKAIRKRAKKEKE